MIFITGGTGFVGNHVVYVLARWGHRVCCLVRPGSEKKLRQRRGIKIVYGDVFYSDLAQKMKGCHTVIHLIGIIREFPERDITFERLHVEATARIVQAAKKAGVKRLLYMSALGTRSHARTKYHQTKYKAEEIVRKSGLNYTIFRPSVIYGPGDHFISPLVNFIKISPFVPIIGNGQYKWQPVHISTVTLGFELALHLSSSFNQTFEVGGPEVLTYNQIVDNIARHLGKRRLKVYIPLKLTKIVTRRAQCFPLYPLTEEMVMMLLEDNIVQKPDFYEVFPLKSISLSQGIGALRW